MKPDDVLLRLKSLPIKPGHSHVQIEQRDFWYLISAIETLTAEKEKLVKAMEYFVHNFNENNFSKQKYIEYRVDFLAKAKEALASVQKGAE